MSNRSKMLDGQTSFGTFSIGPGTGTLIKIMRRLPTGWFGRRLMFALRRLASLGVGESIDTELFGARMRLQSTGNVSEKRALYAPQFFDLEEREALADLAEDNAVFIDIGANIGLYSFSTAASYKRFADTRIIAVEPHPVISNRLAFNLALNPDYPIELVQVGLGDKDSVMTLVSPEKNLGESRLVRNGEDISGETHEVRVTTLLQLLAERKINRLDGMKIDIEGFEEAVLIPFFEKASENLLPKLIVIENNMKQWDTDLIVLAKEKGYDVEKVTRMNVMLRR